MAAVITSRSKIENLPEAQRKKVVDALIEGKSLRIVAEMAGVSHVQVRRYKMDVILPAIRATQQVFANQPLTGTNSEAVQEQTALTKNIIKASPFKERLEKLWNRTDNALEKAENAVREIKDNQGNVVAIAQDLSAIAPLLNQAHKNVELLGRVTGELEQVAAPTVAIQIVMPSTQGPSGPAEVEPPTIDIALPKR